MPPLKDLLLIVFGVFCVLSGTCLVGRNHQYMELLKEHEALLTKLAGLQQDAERTVNAVQKQYDDEKAANAVLVRGLRSQLASLRKSASAGARICSPASGGKGSGEEPDVIGVLLEGAELVAEGAEALRAEHTALKACVDLHERVNGEHSLK